MNYVFSVPSSERIQKVRKNKLLATEEGDKCKEYKSD